MRRITITFVAFFVSSLLVFSQQTADTSKKQPTPSTFMGVSTGINNYVGYAGLNLEPQLGDNLGLDFGLGLGSWGFKFSGALNLYTKGFPEGVVYSFGYSYAPGSGGVEMSLGDVGFEKDKDAKVIFEPAHAVNLSLSYYWLIGQNFRIHLRGGYSLKINPEAYEITNDEALPLSSESKDMLELYQPGGFMLGLGISVGL